MKMKAREYPREQMRKIARRMKRQELISLWIS